MGHPASVDGELVGVVEQGQGSGAGVRVLFERRGSGWAPYAEPCGDEACLAAVAGRYPEQLTWSLLHYGAALGPVTTARPERYTTYAGQGLQPVVGSTGMSGGTLASTMPRLADPDGWRPAKALPGEVRRVRAAFRRSFPEVQNCPVDGVVPKAWSYGDGAVRVRAVLGARTGWRLMEVVLPDYRCDGVVPEWARAQWFSIGRGGAVRRLDAAGMWFVGAADFDGSGRSEVLFGDTDEGWAYRMFDGRMGQVATVRFRAH